MSRRGRWMIRVSTGIPRLKYLLDRVWGRTRGQMGRHSRCDALSYISDSIPALLPLRDILDLRREKLVLTPPTSHAPVRTGLNWYTPCCCWREMRRDVLDEGVSGGKREERMEFEPVEG